MAFRFQYRGIAVSCDTVQEVKELIRDVAHYAPTLESNGHDLTQTHDIPHSITRRWGAGDHARRVRKFLDALAEKQEGVTLSELAEALRFESTKSLGPFQRVLGRKLASKGFDLSDVAVRGTTKDGKPIWRRGPKIAEAQEKFRL